MTDHDDLTTGIAEDTIQWELRPMVLPADPLITPLIGARVSVAYGDGQVLAGVLDDASHMFVSITDSAGRAGPILIQVTSIRTIARAATLPAAGPSAPAATPLTDYSALFIDRIPGGAGHG